jgi:hypothetical protein
VKLGPYRTDASKTLEELCGRSGGNPDNAPTPMVEALIRAGKKPLMALDGREIRLLISQREGFPYILDLVWGMLERDPLQAFEHYDGDVLASLILAPEEVWSSRPEYRAALEGLRARALAAPDEINGMFREVLARQRG